jgi:hypothetical protein
MKDKVTVDGVVLTRAQIEAAVAELDAEEVKDIAIDTDRFESHTIPLTSGDRIHIGERCGGVWRGRGLYLDDAPVGYEWHIISNEEDYGSFDRSATLILRRKA